MCYPTFNMGNVKCRTLCKNISILHYLEECCEWLNSSWLCLFSCSPNTEFYPEADKSITKFFHSKGQLIMVKIISSQTFIWYIVVGKQFHADIHISAPYGTTFKAAYIWHSMVAFTITHTHTRTHTHTQIHIYDTYTHTHKYPYYSHPQKFLQRRNSLMQFQWLDSTHHFAIRKSLLFWTFLEMLKLPTHILPFSVYNCNSVLSIPTTNLQSLQFCIFFIQACYLFLFFFELLLECL